MPQKENHGTAAPERLYVEWCYEYWASDDVKVSWCCHWRRFKWPFAYCSVYAMLINFNMLLSFLCSLDRPSPIWNRGKANTNKKTYRFSRDYHSYSYWNAVSVQGGSSGMPLRMFLNKVPHHRPPCLSMKKLQQSSQIPGSQLKASIQAILFYAHIRVQSSKCIAHQTFMHYMVMYLSIKGRGR